ncbi:hypothetical protein [Kitasatospora sp. NPDC050543]|uniref:hypothetical protein n=1 Tax=Kitasatospora sp. NPDC050543 TaxID=3364054 RepID=UPI0037AC4EBF
MTAAERASHHATGHAVDHTTGTALRVSPPALVFDLVFVLWMYDAFRHPHPVVTPGAGAGGLVVRPPLSMVLEERRSNLVALVSTQIAHQRMVC